MHRHESAFRHWIRTGFGPDAETKFNPWHDPDDGRFTFSGQGNRFGRGHSAARRPKAPAAPTSAAAKPTQRAGGVRRRLEELRRVANVENFKKHIEPFEGDRNDVYLDSKGYPTVGIGHKLPDSYRSKIGERITDAQKEAFWHKDSKDALDAAEQQMQEAGITERDFLLPLASVNFQLGTGWKFDHKETWRLIKSRQYAAAATEAEDSDWFRNDTPTRVRAFQAALMRLERAEQLRRSRKTATLVR